MLSENFAVPSYTVSFFLYLLQAMCKMRAFMHQLSYTASVTILVCVSADRYFVVKHPLVARRQRTKSKLKVALVCIWLFSIMYSVPYGVFYYTFQVQTLSFCLIYLTEKNTRILVTLNFVLLYIVPVSVMAVMYAGMACHLRKSLSSADGEQIQHKTENIEKSLSDADISRKNQASVRIVTKSDPHNCCPANLFMAESQSELTKYQTCLVKSSSHRSQHPRPARRPQPNTGSHQALRSRKRLIKMLFVLVINFSLCVLPYHIRLVYDHWAPKHARGYFIQLIPQITFIILYLNSGLDPVLYAFMSKHFQRCMLEALGCRTRRPTSTYATTNTRSRQ